MKYLEQLQVASDYILSELKKHDYQKPETLVVLGSGLGPFADTFEKSFALKFSDIPHYKSPSVSGHSGELVFAQIKSSTVVFQKGRLHYYEGHSDHEINFPIRSLKLCGVENLVLTNASGSLNPNYRPGDLVVIKDHINFSGRNPLHGKNIEMGPRFPDMTEIYLNEFRETLKELALKQEITLHEGVYFHVAGPSYETPAEIKMFRNLGGDMVGMSTVPEAIAAKHIGLKILGIACITNYGAGLIDQILDHNDVKHEANKAMEKFSTLVKNFLLGLCS